MIFRRTSLFALLFALPLFATHPVALAAPDSAIVSLQPDQLAQFTPALKAISDQAKATIVVEGYPVKSVLPPGIRSKAVTGLPVEQAVAVIAALYDYEVVPRLRVHGPLRNIFVLKKRYSSPYDLPGVTLEEYVLALDDVSRVMKPHLPQPAWTSPFDFARTFFPTLTPEQRQTLEGGGRLPTALLTPKQRAQIERLALNGYTAPLDSPSKDALLILKAADKVAVVKKLSEGEEVFGYNFHEVAYDRTVFRPIRGINRKGQFNADSNTPRSGDDAPAPDRKGVTWEGKDTLDTVVAALQTPSGNTRVMKVDPALAAKPVTVVGAEFTPPGIVLTALANVYGLRVAEEKDGSLLLTRPRIRFAANITDLRESVARLIPEPLLRSLRVESPASEASQNPPGNGRDVAPTASRMMGGASGSDKSVRLVQKAAWRLKGMYDIQKNEADKTGEGQPSSFPEISLSRLPAEGRAAFAVTVLQDFLSQLFFFSDRPTPATITDFETGFLTGGMHEEQGDQHFSLMLNVETETPGAKTTNATGFSGIWYAEVKNK